MTVDAEEAAAVGITVSAAHAEDGDPWHALSDEQKVNALQSMLKTEIERMMPALLRERRP